MNTTKNNQKNNKLENLLITTPFGKNLLNNELIFYHNITRTIFGYYALQIGLPQIDFLKTNKISNKYIFPTQINCDLPALPFATNSIDLIICPHILEFMPNYEELLQECYRVLIPKGKLIITNFNRKSFLGLSNTPKEFAKLFKKKAPTDIEALIKQQLKAKSQKKVQIPPQTQSIIQDINWIGLNEIKNSLIKANFMLFGGKFLNYLPPCNNVKILSNLEWLNNVGDRWFPSYANTYAIIASKETITFTRIKPETKRQYVKQTSVELSGI